LLARILFLLPSLLFSHIAAHLALKLVKALNLLRGKDAAYLGTNIRLQSDLVPLRGRQRLGGSAYFGFVISLAHYRAIEGLAGLSYAAARGDYVVVVASPDLLNSRPLRASEPDCLHDSLLQLLFPERIRIDWPISAGLRQTKRRPFEPTLTTREAVWANLTLCRNLDRRRHQSCRNQ
jgi:hypothetical protein